MLKNIQGPECITFEVDAYNACKNTTSGEITEIVKDMNVLFLHNYNEPMVLARVAKMLGKRFEDLFFMELRLLGSMQDVHWADNVNNIRIVFYCHKWSASGVNVKVESANKVVTQSKNGTKG